jgi:transcriptional regulator with XRE-family HTH domain
MILLMDSEIGSRLRQLRNVLQLSQAAFAQKLDVSSATIAATESGKRKLTKANTKLICLTFNINERWGTGEGPIFTSVQDAIAGLDELIETFKLLQPIRRKMVLSHAHYLLDSQTDPEPDPDPDPDLDPDPEPTLQGRPGYVINEELPANSNRDIEDEPVKKLA